MHSPTFLLWNCADFWPNLISTCRAPTERICKNFTCFTLGYAWMFPWSFLIVFRPTFVPGFDPASHEKWRLCSRVPQGFPSYHSKHPPGWSVPAIRGPTFPGLRRLDGRFQDAQGSHWGWRLPDHGHQDSPLAEKSPDSEGPDMGDGALKNAHWIVEQSGTHQAHQLPESTLLRIVSSILSYLWLCYLDPARVGGVAFSEAQAIFAVTAMHKKPDFAEWFVFISSRSTKHILVGGLEHFIFPNSWDDDPLWLIFFRRVETCWNHQLVSLILASYPGRVLVNIFFSRSFEQI